MVITPDNALCKKDSWSTNVLVTFFENTSLLRSSWFKNSLLINIPLPSISNKITGFAGNIQLSKIQDNYIFNKPIEINEKMTTNYKNDKEDGLYEQFYENGQLKEKGSYNNGSREGQWFKYHHKGHLIEKGYYKNGKLEGEFLIFNREGRLIKKLIYENGILTKIKNINNSNW